MVRKEEVRERMRMNKNEEREGLSGGKRRNKRE